MPTRAPTFRPRGGLTKAERVKAQDRRRGSPVDRGYDWAWKRLRDLHLHDNPFCAFHLAKGRRVLADMVDHVVPIAEAPERRLDGTNLQSLCDPCHKSRKAREEASGRAARRALREG